jgi:hypothetical protein
MVKSWIRLNTAGQKAHGKLVSLTFLGFTQLYLKCARNSSSVRVVILHQEQ